jgi:hypothetical protein
MDQLPKHAGQLMAQSSIRPPQRSRPRAARRKSSSGCLVILFAFSGALAAGIEVVRRLT